MYCFYYSLQHLVIEHCYCIAETIVNYQTNIIVIDFAQYFPDFIRMYAVIIIQNKAQQ